MERLNGIWLSEVTPVITSRPPGFRLFGFSSHRGTDAIEDYVDATAAGQFLHPLAEFRGSGVIDHLIGAELFSLLQFPVAASGGNGARAIALGPQQTRAAHATPRRLDQKVLSRLESHPLDETKPGGMASQGKCRRFLKVRPIRDALQVGSRDLTILGMSPGEFASQAIPLFTILILSEHTWLTATTLDTVLDDNSVARLPTFDPGDVEA
jgi:hypothetical protein